MCVDCRSVCEAARGLYGWHRHFPLSSYERFVELILISDCRSSGEAAGAGGFVSPVVLGRGEVLVKSTTTTIPETSASQRVLCKRIPAEVTWDGLSAIAGSTCAASRGRQRPLACGPGPGHALELAPASVCVPSAGKLIPSRRDLARLRRPCRPPWGTEETLVGAREIVGERGRTHGLLLGEAYLADPLPPDCLASTPPTGDERPYGRRRLAGGSRDCAVAILGAGRDNAIAALAARGAGRRGRTSFKTTEEGGEGGEETHVVAVVVVAIVMSAWKCR